MNTVEIAAYHHVHGDDYGSERAREAKYKAILSLADFRSKRVLDAGCGERQFQEWLPPCLYAGVDLREGQDVLAVSDPYDIVVANGIFYKGGRERMLGLLLHLWTLADEALIFTSLSTWAPTQEPGEYHASPRETLQFCKRLTPKLALRHDYSPRDFAMALYR